MRNRFPGYYRPSQKEFDHLWNQGIIAPDTNILLHLFRYGPETRAEVFDTLKRLKAQVWVPYRVGFEFHRGWRDVDATNRNAYESLIAEIQKAGNKLESLYDQVSRHQVIDAKAEKAKVSGFISDLCSSITEAKKRHPSAEAAEKLFEEISDLIGDAVGTEPSTEEYEGWVKEGKQRYENDIPPGYKDKNNPQKVGNDIYGDFFIWKELIAKAKADEKPIIFVTDDRKEDWFLGDGRGKTISPRPELIKEFREEAGQQVYLYTFRNFLDQASKRAKTSISKSTIAEIEREEKAFYQMKHFVAPDQIRPLDGIASESNIAAISEKMLTDIINKKAKRYFYLIQDNKEDHEEEIEKLILDFNDLFAQAAALGKLRTKDKKYRGPFYITKDWFKKVAQDSNLELASKPTNRMDKFIPLDSEEEEEEDD